MTSPLNDPPARFHKYQALGNDMVVLDPATFARLLTPELIRRICHRHFGLGADGICYGPLPSLSPPQMRFFNPDGSEAEKSGNGLRIFARYLWDQGYVTGRQYEIGINQETIAVRVEDDAAQTITTAIGRLSFHSADIPVAGRPRQVIDEPITVEADGQEYSYHFTAVSVGNPHCVIFVPELSTAEVKRLGPILETTPLFPRRSNVQFARPVDRHTIEIEIWERGAGYTLASGTSASAAAGAAIRTGRCRSPVEVHMAGGAVRVAIDDDWQVTLTGRVAAVCDGQFAPDFWREAEDAH
jgi:diaminopimelate epimerase